MRPDIAFLDPVKELFDKRPVAELEGLETRAVEEERVGALVGHPRVPDHHCVQGFAQPGVCLRVHTQEMTDSKVGHTH